MDANRPEVLGGGEEVVRVDVYFPDAHQQIPELDQDDSVGEELAVSRIGLRLCPIQESPLFSGAGAWGDLVEGDIDDGQLVTTKVVDNTQFTTIRTMIPRMFYFFDFGKAFLDRVLDPSGMWENISRGIPILNLPRVARRG